MDISVGGNKIILKKYFLRHVNFRESTGEILHNTRLKDIEYDDSRDFIELEDIEIEKYHFFDFVNHKRKKSDVCFINFKVLKGDCSYNHYKVTKFHPIDILKYAGTVEIMAELDLGDYGLESEGTGEYRDADVGDIDDFAIKEFLFNNREIWEKK